MVSATLFDGARQTLEEALEATALSLLAHATGHSHWAFAWSGGKDSTALWTVVNHLVQSGRVPAPKSMTVLRADTRLEIQPLWLVADGLAGQLSGRGVDVVEVVAPVDARFFVYILGYGVPPPHNKSRWCTQHLKIDPMTVALAQLRQRHGDKLLLLTGLRLGESAARDARIALACNKDGGECGQGWFQQTLPDSAADRLAPLLHWRVCHVMDWLAVNAPDAEYGGWDTRPLVRVYGDGEGRFGCVGCPLVQEDKALERSIRSPGWAHLAPLRELAPLFLDLRHPSRRLRQPGGKTRKDGSLAKGQNRMGPLTPEARLWGLERVLDIQARVCAGAVAAGKPPFLLVTAEEEARIRALAAAGVWPEGWTGDEPRADELHERWFDSGAVQPLLPMFGPEEVRRG